MNRRALHPRHRRTRWAALAAALLAVPALAATRTVEVPLDASSVEIYNLVGHAVLAPGDGPMRVIATITADDPAHAEAVRLSTDDNGGTTRLKVLYPEDVDTVRVDLPDFSRIRADVRYLDRRIRLDDRSGDLVRVDLEIRVPDGAKLRVSNEAGHLQATQVVARLGLRARYGGVRVADGRGSLFADTGAGPVEVTGFRGDVAADTGSGTVTIENVLGNVRADTGSGQVRLRGVDGDVEADTGSGSVRFVDVRAGEIRADTGSGSVRMEDVTGSIFVDTGSGGLRADRVVAGSRVEVDTGSGGVEINGDLAAVERLNIDTGSGSVALTSTTPLSLRLELETGSGGIDVDVPDLSDVRSKRGDFRAVAGTGRGIARVDTGSGGVRITAP